jgi:hypothetical protein
MDRREALRRMVLGPVGAACAAAWVDGLTELALASAAQGQAAADAAAWTPRVFTARQDATVTELSELIIPQTDTAGARAAYVNRFIDAVLDDAPDSERESFLRGLAWMDRRSRELHGTDFVDAPAEAQVALLTAISSREDTAASDIEGVEFFEAIKRLTVTGYYTSEAGMREELGDDGTLHFSAVEGCAHPQHRA